MKSNLALVMLYTVIVSDYAIAVGFAPKVDLPDNVNINVQLSVHPNQSANLIITNESSKFFKAASPFARNAVAFLVSDEYGNIVKPEGVAKADPPSMTINLPVKKSSSFIFNNLNFVTGTAMFGYRFKLGKKYRVVAIYRPAGLDGPGFSSTESIVEFE